MIIKTITMYSNHINSSNLYYRDIIPMFDKVQIQKKLILNQDTSKKIYVTPESKTELMPGDLFKIVFPMWITVNIRTLGEDTVANLHKTILPNKEDLEQYVMYLFSLKEGSIFFLYKNTICVV